MKILRLAIIAACFSTTLTFSQNVKVQTAYNYNKDQQFDKAKEAIDEAITNEQSMGKAKTWYYRGLIYSSLYKNEKFGQLCNNCLVTSYESFNKALELDPKNEWADEIKALRIPYLSGKIFEEGVNSFKSQDYNKALTSFETVDRMTPGDTSVILNCAYSAERGGNNSKAKEYYGKLMNMNFSDEKIYTAMSNIYKTEKDTAKALEVIRQGRQKYPKSNNLMLQEINLLLLSGNSAAATKPLEDAITLDPQNAALYLALGSTYDNLANPRDPNTGKETSKPKDYSELASKAEDAYKRGLTVSPDNYELNYNLGALYFNQAADLANQANNAKTDADFNKAKAKFEAKFREAEPHLEKAMEKNPKKTDEDVALYKGTLNSLKQLYVRLNENDKYAKIKALIDQQ